MGTTNTNKSDIYHLNNIVQNTMFSHAKEVFIETLRDIFSQDSYYHYTSDPWGFPQTPTLKNKDPEAGLHDNVSTRIYIGEAYRYDMIFYPALLVRGGSFRSVPISISRNEELVKYKSIQLIDGYGNKKIISTPECYELAGAWEGQVSVDVIAGDIQSRDELVGLVAASLQIIRFHEFQKAGVYLKPNGINIGSPTETDDMADKVYKQNITCEVRTEWRQRIPISTVVDAINFCVDFADSVTAPFPDPNLEIKTTIELIDTIQNM